MWERLIAILVLAVLLAACGGDDAVVEVSGQTDCVEADSTASGPALADDVPFTSVDITYECDYTMSDERVSGSGPAVITVDMSLDGDTRVGQISGTINISNDGGTWAGTVSGTTTWTPTTQHVHVLDGVYAGTGDYEGLRFLVHNEGTLFPWTTTGRIESAE